MINCALLNYKVMQFLDCEHGHKLTLMNKNYNKLNIWNKIIVDDDDYYAVDENIKYKIINIETDYKIIEKYKSIKIRHTEKFETYNIYERINNMINIDILLEIDNSNKKISKEVSERIIKNNKNLNILKLKGGGFIMEDLIEELKINKSIKVLYFTSQHLNDFQYYGELVKCNRNIKILTIENKKLINFNKKKYDYSPLFEGLKYNKTLNKLTLKGSNDFDISIILDVLKYNQTLEELEIFMEPISFEDDGKNYDTKNLIKFFIINNKEIKILSDILKNNKTIKIIKFKHMISYYKYHCEKSTGLNFEYNEKKKILKMYKSYIDSKGYDYMINALDSRPIKILNLDGCKIGDDKCKYICELLKRHAEIEIINLKKNNISDKGWAYLIDGLQNLEVLRILNLSCNKIQECGYKYLYEGLKNTKTLEEINTLHNFMACPWNNNLIQILEKNPNIRILNLESVSHKDDNIKSLCKILEKNNKIEELDIINSSLDDQGSEFFRDFIKKSKTLRKIGINPLLMNFKIIFEGLKDNKSIKSLHIYRLPEDQVKYLSDSLINNQVIEELKLPFIDISLTNSKLLAKIIKSTSSLKRLDLTNSTNLDNNNFKAICSALIDNNTIEELDLSCSEIFVENGVTDEFKKLTREHKSLKLLYLDYCNNLSDRAIVDLNSISKNKIQIEGSTFAHSDDYDDDYDDYNS